MLEFTILREELFKNLFIIQNIIGKKGNLIILENILIVSNYDKIIIFATDLEIGIKNTLLANIIQEGSITLPGKKLFEITRETNTKIIKLQVKENNWITITAGTSIYNLAGLPSEDFPKFPDYEQITLVNIQSQTLKKLIEKTIFSIANTGESRFTLTGILLENEKKGEINYLKMVSSDGHRLSLMEVPVDNVIEKLNFNQIIIIPKKGIVEMLKICEGNENINIGFDDKQFILNKENLVVVIRLMNGDFPKYYNIIPNVNDNNNYVEINRVAFLNALKCINLFSEDQYNAITYILDKNSLTLVSRGSGLGNAKDNLEVSYNGEPINLGFNCKYFIDLLQVLNSNFIKMYIISEENPCLIRADDDEGFLGVVMPMKI